MKINHIKTTRSYYLKPSSGRRKCVTFWRYTQIIFIPPIIKGHQVESSNEIVIDQTLADKGFKIGTSYLYLNQTKS